MPESANSAITRKTFNDCMKMSDNITDSQSEDLNEIVDEVFKEFGMDSTIEVTEAVNTYLNKLGHNRVSAKTIESLFESRIVEAKDSFSDNYVEGTVHQGMKNMDSIIRSFDSIKEGAVRTDGFDKIIDSNVKSGIDGAKEGKEKFENAKEDSLFQGMIDNMAADVAKHVSIQNPTMNTDKILQGVKQMFIGSASDKNEENILGCEIEEKGIAGKMIENLCDQCGDTFYENHKKGVKEITFALSNDLRKDMNRSLNNQTQQSQSPQKNNFSSIRDLNKQSCDKSL